MSALNRKLKVDWKLLVPCAVFALMVFARDMGLFAFSPIHFTAVVILISLWLPYQKLMSFFFFYISVGIGVHGAACLFLVFFIIIKARRYNIRQFGFAIVLMLIEIIHFATYSFNVDMIRYIFFVLYVIAFFFVLFDETIDDSVQRNYIQYYVNGVVIASLIVIIHSINGFGFNEVFLESMRIGSDFNQVGANQGMQTVFNSNQLAYFSITAFTLVLFVKNIYSNKPIKGIMMFCLVLTGVLTASRTWIILMALVLAWFFMSSNVKGKFGFIIATLVLLFLADRYVTYTMAFEERFASRFDETSARTAGNRTVIFKEYNKWLSDNPQRIIFGTGANYCGEVTQIKASIHNGIQQIIVFYGIVGLLLFICCFLIFYHRFPKKHKLKFSNYIPVLICVIFIQSGQFLFPSIMMIPCLATALPLKLTSDVVE